jgi:hypothetical protein
MPKEWICAACRHVTPADAVARKFSCVLCPNCGAAERMPRLMFERNQERSRAESAEARVRELEGALREIQEPTELVAPQALRKVREIAARILAPKQAEVKPPDNCDFCRGDPGLEAKCPNKALTTPEPQAECDHEWRPPAISGFGSDGRMFGPVCKKCFVREELACVCGHLERLHYDFPRGCDECECKRFCFGHGTGKGVGK